MLADAAAIAAIYKIVERLLTTGSAEDQG